MIARLARKELREILRDRRTIFTLVLMPILLYPLLGLAFYQYLSALGPTKEVKYRVAASKEDLARARELFERDDEALKKIIPIETIELEEALRRGDAELALSFKPESAKWNPNHPNRSLTCELLRRDDSPQGLAAEDFLQERFARLNIELLRTRLAYRGVREPAIPVQTELRAIVTPEARKASYLSTLVPLILVLMTITGAVYPAIDLTAGERERGTLEILMAAPIPRLGLLLAKYIAVLTVALLTGLINLTMMTVTLLLTKLGTVVFEGGLSFGVVIAVLGLLVLFAMFFSAVLLAVTSFARSFKEAQAYLIPLMLLSISPGMVAMLPGLKLGGLLSITPLLNVVLLAREVLAGVATLTDAAVVVLSTLFYAGAAIAIAARIFGAEAVLYSDQSHWSDLFRRPRQERVAATIPAALFCLAVLFAASILASYGLAQLREVLVPLAARGLQFVVPIGLFVGLPLLVARQGRVNLSSGFQLFSTSLVMFAAALLLGMSLWPLVSEVAALEKWAGFTSTPEWLKDAFDAEVERWRADKVLTLLVFAVVPAVVEEFFFRGFLFNAICSTTRARTAILATAALFGLFHVFTSGILTIERFLPTALMGLALGWLRWRSGSVFPGMLLHALHNGLLLSLELFPSALSAQLKDAQHIPLPWLLLGAAGAALGLGLTWLRKPAEKAIQPGPEP